MTFLLPFILLGQHPTVSLEIRAERLSVAAPKIAKALGMNRITVAAPFTDEVAAIRVVNVDQMALKQKIERAFHGTFAEREGGWIFEQTLEQKTDERTRHFQALAKSHQEVIDAAKKKVLEAKTFNVAEANRLLDFRDKMVGKMYGDDELTEKDYEDGRVVQQATPGGRFALEIIARLLPSHWRQLDYDRRRCVFSLNPTQVQFPLPFSSGELISNLVTRQRLYSQLGLARAKAINPIVEDDEVDNRDLKSFEPSDFANLLLILEENRAVVCAFNSKGERTFSENISYNDLVPDEDSDEIEKKYAKLGPKLSPLAKEYLQLVDDFYNDSEETYADIGVAPDKQISSQLRAALSNPEQVDPFSVAVPEVLFGSNPSQNIVANVSEYMLLYRNLSVDFLKENPWWVADYEAEDGWLICKLPDPYDLRRWSPKRARMTQVFRLFQGSKYPSLEQQAVYAKELSSEDSQFNVTDFHLGLLLRGTGTPPPTKGIFLQLYGALSGEERARAFRQATSLGAFNDSFLWLLADCIIYEKYYGMYPRPKVTFESGSTGPTKEQLEQYVRAAAEFSEGLSEEPTFRHPSGLTTGMTFSMREDESALISVKLLSPINGQKEHQITPLALGMNLFRKEFPSQYPSALKTLSNYDMNSLDIRTYRVLSMSVSTSDAWEYWINQIEPEVAGKKLYSVETLPENIHSLVRKGYEQAKQLHENPNINVRSNGLIPPLKRR